MALGLLRFTNALGGTADFIYPGPATDMQSPASAGAVNGTTYLYYAQSLDMTQWEIGKGAYASAGGTFARTTVTANSLGTTAKINFTNGPQVVVFDTFPTTDLSAYSTTAQMNTAIALAGPVGQCKFVYVDATHCALMPFNGNQLKVNGSLYSIPAAGVSIDNSGLAVNTLYYCYASIISGNVALSWSTTGHQISTGTGNIGTETIIGTDTKSLVGMVYTNASSQFVETAQYRGVRSWFNDPGIRLFQNGTVAFSAPVGTWGEETGMRTVAPFWKDEQVEMSGFAISNNNGLGNVNYVSPYQNGNTPIGLPGFTYQMVANYYAPIPFSYSFGVTSDQAMTLSIAGQISGGANNWSYRSMTVMTHRK